MKSLFEQIYKESIASNRYLKADDDEISCYYCDYNWIPDYNYEDDEEPTALENVEDAARAIEEYIYGDDGDHDYPWDAKEMANELFATGSVTGEVLDDDGDVCNTVTFSLVDSF